MNADPEPKITHSKPFPLVWIVPAVALIVGGYLVFREVRETGPRISIVFEEGGGLETGETVLQYKGVTVGRVDSVSLTEDLQRVEVGVTLQRSARGLAREGSNFWILRPEIGLEGVSGLDTLITGPTIQVTPGDGPLAKEFEGLSRAPIGGGETGYHYILRRNTLGSLKKGAPVLYKDYKVGEVIRSRLADDATSVLVEIVVNTPYQRLVRDDSVFWDASGIAMKVGLLGARIQAQSLESVLAGGVQFATPEGVEDTGSAPEFTEFHLHSEPEDDWLDWSPTIPLE